MSNDPKAFSVTLFYTDAAGGQHSIRALVLGADPKDAMQGAIEAVSSLPNCAEVLGGILEEASEADLDAVLASLGGPNARAETRQYRPQGATVH